MDNTSCREAFKNNHIYIEHAWEINGTLPDNRNYITIAYIAYGNGTVFLDSKKFDVTRADIFVIHPGVKVDFQVYVKEGKDPVFEIYYICFTEKFLEGKWEAYAKEFITLEPFIQNEGHSYIKVTDSSVFEIRGYIVRMINEYFDNQPGRELALQGCLLSMLSVLLRRYDILEEYVFSKNTLVDQTIRRVRGWIYYDPKPSEIARNRHVSREYLGRLFKKETGLTLTQYINHLRIEMIKDILENTDRRIEEIAMLFNCRLKYLQKTFKENTGMTMRDYRKKYHYR